MNATAYRRHTELTAEYPQGVVNAPGKFEGEPIAAIYFWELLMDGCQDDVLNDGDTVIDLFDVNADDRALWDLDADTTRIAISVTEQGFVTFEEWTDADYKVLSAALDAAQNDDDDEPQEDDLTTSDHQKWYQSGKLVLLHAANGAWYRLDMKAFPAGVLIGEFGDDHAAAIKAFYGLTNFSPNAWFISDHGNAHRIEL